MRQNLVFHRDQADRLFGDGFAGGGDSSNGVTIVKRLVAGQAVNRHIGEEIILGLCKISAGDDSLDARQLFRRRGVNRPDARMGMRAAQDPAMQHAGGGNIRAIGRLAGHLVDPVGAGHPCADNLEIARRLCIESHVTHPSFQPRRSGPP